MRRETGFLLTSSGLGNGSVASPTTSPRGITSAAAAVPFAAGGAASPPPSVKTRVVEVGVGLVGDSTRDCIHSGTVRCEQSEARRGDCRADEGTPAVRAKERRRRAGEKAWRERGSMDAHKYTTLHTPQTSPLPVQLRKATAAFRLFQAMNACAPAFPRGRQRSEACGPGDVDGGGGGRPSAAPNEALGARAVPALGGTAAAAIVAAREASRTVMVPTGVADSEREEAPPPRSGDV